MVWILERFSQDAGRGATQCSGLKWVRTMMVRKAVAVLVETSTRPVVVGGRCMVGAWRGSGMRQVGGVHCAACWDGPEWGRGEGSSMG